MLVDTNWITASKAGTHASATPGSSSSCNAVPQLQGPCCGAMGPGLRRGGEWMSDERFLRKLFRGVTIQHEVIGRSAGAPRCRILTVRGDSPPAPSPGFRRGSDRARSFGEGGTHGSQGVGRHSGIVAPYLA